MTVTLTKDERDMILNALRVAAEDGSLYGGATSPDEFDAVNAMLESLTAKLKG